MTDQKKPEDIADDNLDAVQGGALCNNEMIEEVMTLDDASRIQQGKRAKKDGEVSIADLSKME